MKSELTFRMDDVDYKVDIGGLTLDDWIELEELGIEFTAGAKIGMKVMKGIAYIAIHRERPDVTFDQIGKLEMMTLIGGATLEEDEVADENPTSPASESTDASD